MGLNDCFIICVNYGENFPMLYIYDDDDDDDSNLMLISMFQGHWKGIIRAINLRKGGLSCPQNYKI